LAKKSGRRSGSVVTIHDVARHAGVSRAAVDGFIETGKQGNLGSHRR